MRTDDERAAFEAALAEDPYDGDTRKVFADWLEEHGFDDEAVLQRAWTPEKMREAEEWLTAFAADCSGEPLTAEELAEYGLEDEVDLASFTFGIDEMIKAAHAYLDTGEWLCIGTETPELALSEEGMETFWQHFMVVTGRPVPSKKRRDCFIHCAC